jgi:PTS system fructose-specific IIC component/PTS system nitrogen regulatory IIA component
MRLSETFLPQHIIVDLKATTKEGVFEELVEHFCNVTNRRDRHDEILDALRAREVRMTTGVYAGIAIPHGKTAAVDKSYGILGISHSGISYESLDGAPVYLVFMELAPPVADAEHHLHLLKRIAELLRKPEFVKEIESARDTQSVCEILKRFEELSA